MKTSTNNRHTLAEELGITTAGFAWDLAAQLVALRKKRGVTQAELALMIGTQQQVITRIESPSYGRQNLSSLRKVAHALDAFVDVTIVPAERLGTYRARRYLPLLADQSDDPEADSLDVG